MKRIGFITDHWEISLASRALEDLGQLDEFQIETIDDFHTVDSISQAVWDLINLVDVVVAYISKGQGNIYYEIGLAHGLGKPVILILDDAVLEQAPLAGQRAIQINSLIDTPQSLAFRLKEAIAEASKKDRPFSGPHAHTENQSAYISDDFAMSSVGDFRSLLAYEGVARGLHFERWFASIAQAVLGWDVVESEKRAGPDRGFDLVIWNSRKDPDLSVLGNPIAIELKAIRSMNSASLSHFLHRAKISGLKGVVLATTGTNTQQTKKRLARLRKDEGIRAIAIDRDDLIQVSTPDHLLHLFKQKSRELLYDREF